MGLEALTEAKPGEIKGAFSPLSLYPVNCRGLSPLSPTKSFRHSGSSVKNANTSFSNRTEFQDPVDQMSSSIRKIDPSPPLVTVHIADGISSLSLKK